MYTQILDKLFLDHGICCNFILCNVELMTLALAQRSSRQGVRRWKLCKDTVAPCRFLEWGPLSMADLQIPVSISNYRSVSYEIKFVTQSSHMRRPTGSRTPVLSRSCSVDSVGSTCSIHSGPMVHVQHVKKVRGAAPRARDVSINRHQRPQRLSISLCTLQAGPRCSLTGKQTHDHRCSLTGKQTHDHYIDMYMGICIHICTCM